MTPPQRTNDNGPPAPIGADREVTVIIPTRNRARFIGRALSSLAAQSHRSFEVLIADDSDGTDTEEEVARFADARFRYDRPDVDRGFYGACAHALEQTASPVVAFMSDDDQVTPNYLEVLHGHLRRSPSTVAAYARSPWAAEGQAPFRVSKPDARIEGGGPWGFLAHLRQDGGDRLARFWGMFRREHIRAALALPFLADDGKPMLGRDFLMFFYLCMQGRIAYTEEAEYRFLFHPHQVGRDRSQRRFGVFETPRFNVADNLVGYAYMVDRISEELDRLAPDFPVVDKVLFSYCLWAWYAQATVTLIGNTLGDHGAAIRQLGLGDVADAMDQVNRRYRDTQMLVLNVDRPPYFPPDADGLPEADGSPEADAAA